LDVAFAAITAAIATALVDIATIHACYFSLAGRITNFAPPVELAPCCGDTSALIPLPAA